MNAEFQKYFPQSEYIPVLRNLETNRYWINENLLKIQIGKRTVNIMAKIKGNANKTYSIKAIVDKYMDCIEEVINIPALVDRFQATIQQEYLNKVLDEIVIQNKVEFNYGNDEHED